MSFSTEGQVSGQHQFGGSVAAFDQWADNRLEKLRGKPAADFVFTKASHLGDFSLIWHLIGTARGLISPRNRRQALVLSGLLGVESLVVNQGLKRLFRRSRPTQTGDDRFPVRQPRTSSFPSGHATSAFVAATLLTTWGGKRTAPLWFGLASIVATSRVFVRIHHASDVAGGALVGLALGQIAQQAARRLLFTTTD